MTQSGKSLREQVEAFLGVPELLFDWLDVNFGGDMAFDVRQDDILYRPIRSLVSAGARTALGAPLAAMSLINQQLPHGGQCSCLALLRRMPTESQSLVSGDTLTKISVGWPGQGMRPFADISDNGATSLLRDAKYMDLVLGLHKRAAELTSPFQGLLEKAREVVELAA